MKAYAIRVSRNRGVFFVNMREGILPVEHGIRKWVPVGDERIAFDRRNPPEIMGDQRIHDVHPVKISNKFWVLMKPDDKASKIRDVLINIIHVENLDELGEVVARDGRESLLRLALGEKIEIAGEMFANANGELISEVESAVA